MNREKYFQAKNQHYEFLHAELESKIVTLGKLIIVRLSAEELKDKTMYQIFNDKISDVKLEIAELKKSIELLEKELKL